MAVRTCIRNIRGEPIGLPHYNVVLGPGKGYITSDSVATAISNLGGEKAVAENLDVSDVPAGNPTGL